MTHFDTGDFSPKIATLFMSENSRAVRWLVWSGLALVVMAISLAYVRETTESGRHGAVDTHALALPDFSLVNQAGDSVTLAHLKRRVWIAAIISTRDPGPSAQIMANLAALQAATPTSQPVRFITLTADPDHDTPEVLKKYGEGFGAKPGNWHLLTGEKAEIQALAVDSLKLNARTGGANTADGIMPGTKLVVVDKAGKPRGVFEGTDAKTRPQVLALLSQLAQEAPPPLPVLWPVKDFSLTNQSGQIVTLADLNSNVWVGGIIFTRCPGPCPRMTANLAAVQAAIPSSAPVKFVLLTSDPGHDTGPVLRRFGDRFGVKFTNWHFLSGSKGEIRNLAIDGLKLIAEDKEAAKQTSPNDLFIHSTTFVVVDKTGHVRAAFDGADAGLKDLMIEVITELSGKN